MDFNNTGAMRSPFSPRVRQSISGRRAMGLSSAKKNQSQVMPEPSGDVIYKTPQMTVETYGPPLPVMVTEALTFCSGDITVRMSPCGWCWVVSGRRILAWPLSSAGDCSAAPPARDLMLPQTDLAHKADLVVLYYEDGAQMPSCVGVSPEGVVRYWASVAQDTHAESSCELGGQECARLVYAGGRLLLATTSCQLLLLTPAARAVAVRTLRPPAGWLGGISRRVSHLFFGAMPQHQDTKLVGVVGVGRDAVALVAGGVMLQVWRGPELQQLHEHSLRRQLIDAHHLQHHGEQSGVELVTLDVQPGGEHHLVLLLAAVNVVRAPDYRYSIAHVSLEEPASPRVTCVVPVCAGGADEEPPRLLLLPAHALVYTSSSVALVSTRAAAEKPEQLSLCGESERVLGAACVGSRALLFSRKHGVLLLAAHRLQRLTSVCDSPPSSPCPTDMYEGNLALYEIDPNEICVESSDLCGKLKTAFLFHVRRDSVACRSVLQEAFPEPRGDVADVDAALDRTVLRVATQLLDDVPAGDPRWLPPHDRPATDVPLGSSSALRPLQQLQDKRRAFTMLLDFLREHRLWGRLRRVSAEGGGTRSTESALRTLAESLSIATALCTLQAAGGAAGGAVEGALAAAAAADAEAPAGVTAAEVCYRRVSSVRRVLRAACAAVGAGGVLCCALAAVRRVRARWPLAAPLVQHDVQLLRLARDVALHAAQQGPAEAEGAAALAAALLDDVEPMTHTHPHLYNDLRAHLIQAFLDAGEPQRACALAEKYGALEVLVQVCVQRGDYARLRDYLQSHAAQGMADTAYAWLLERGHAAVLLRQLGRDPRLSAWLARAPPRQALHALHVLHDNDPHAAAALLADLAHTTTDNVHRLKTMSSLGKLCAAASVQRTEDSTAQRLSAALQLAEHHERLPAHVRRSHGLDTDVRVLEPEQLVHLYVTCTSSAMTEYDYKHALHLARDVLDTGTQHRLTLDVWCACIERSDWDATEDEDELRRNNMFYKLVDLVVLMEGSSDTLPSLQAVVSAPSLQHLVQQPRVHHLIRTALVSVGQEHCASHDAPVQSAAPLSPVHA